MAYIPTLISPADYPDIRVALGLDGTDTTTLPDSVIEARPYLQFVEYEVQATITSYATILSGGGGRAAALALGVVYGTAARLAGLWLAARQGAEVKSQGLGPASVSFREGPKWAELAERLAGEAATALHRAEYWTSSLQSIQMVGRAGPTRKARDDGAMLSRTTIIERLLPEVVKGHDWTDHSHEEAVG